MRKAVLALTHAGGNLLPDFNLLVTTARGNERQMINEILYLLREMLGDQTAEASKTGIRGLIVAKTSLSIQDVLTELRAILHDRPYEFRYALRIVPIQQIVRTELDEIKHAAEGLAAGIGENETFRITVEKRFTSLHARDLIETVAEVIQRKVNLDNPDKVLLIEVLGGLAGISLIKRDDILAVLKEKLL
jgi:tRNA acetyltransferase TAN1